MLPKKSAHRFQVTPTEQTAVAPGIVTQQNRIPGKFFGSYSTLLTSKAYHAESASISCSRLKPLLRSHAHFKAAEANRSGHGTPSQLLGTLFHASVLEPELFNSEYVSFRGPQSDLRRQQFMMENASKKIIPPEIYQQVEKMRDSLIHFPIPQSSLRFGDHVALGETETSIFWVDEETGVQCKIRPDLMCRSATFDLKSCDDARPAEFMNFQALKLDWDMQAAMYFTGVHAFTGEERPFIFAAVETNDTHSVWLHEVGPGVPFFENGMRKFRYALREFAKLKSGDETFGYTNAYSRLDLPVSSRFLFNRV